MPTTLQESEIGKISDLMEFVEGGDDLRWYRGSGNFTYNLLPSLYRHPKLEEYPDTFELEYQIILRFRHRSVPFLSSSVLSNADKMESLFLMQHFGVPTRLLDWTESPYIALYFALTSARWTINKETQEKVYSDDCCIWVLKPNEWNRHCLRINPSPGPLIYPSESIDNGYLPDPDIGPRRQRKDDPVALSGVHNNPRIVAQRGVFTLFGSSKKPMETIYIDSTYPQDSLFKIRIKAENIENLIKDLSNIGVTDAVIYPDLFGLSTEIKRHFGYYV